MKKLNLRRKNSIRSSGFTILELVVVIVIIGIIASVTIATYIGTIPSTRDAGVLSDIDTMEGLQTDYGIKNSAAGKVYYGSANDAALGFTPSSGNVIDVVTNSTDYCIRGFNPNGTKNSIWNAFTKESKTGVCTNQLSPSVAAAGSTCPVGYIRVPGSVTYGTNDFCVMKYEAKNIGGVATSQAAGTPWVNVTQVDSITASDAACPGCHLISEARWLTIVQNLLGITGNWSNNAVGNGHVYVGHSDNVPANALAADTVDSNGYFGTGDISPSFQRRTLTLSNGNVIWDLAGNIWEWTSGTTQGAVQPGITGVGYAWREWCNITNPGTLVPNPSPAATGYSGASGWYSNNGMGFIESSSDDVTPSSILRSGSWSNLAVSGVMSMNLDYGTTDARAYFGFRVVR